MHFESIYLQNVSFYFVNTLVRKLKETDRHRTSTQRVLHFCELKHSTGYI